MKKLLLSTVIALAAMVHIASAEDAKPETCLCKCQKCPPVVTLSTSIRGETKYRKCFRDDNNNNRCDGGERPQKPCGNRCRSLTGDSKKNAEKRVTSPCEGCPCAANCSKCAFAN